MKVIERGKGKKGGERQGRGEGGKGRGKEGGDGGGGYVSRGRWKRRSKGAEEREVGKW